MYSAAATEPIRSDAGAAEGRRVLRKAAASAPAAARVPIVAGSVQPRAPPRVRPSTAPNEAPVPSSEAARVSLGTGSRFPAVAESSHAAAPAAHRTVTGTFTRKVHLQVYRVRAPPSTTPAAS